MDERDGVADILAEILEHKRGEVEQAKAERTLERLKDMPGYSMMRRNFYGAVACPQLKRPNLIAEIKKRSPSAGLIRPDFDPVAIAQMYEEAGAVALSVLTDLKYFEGELDFIGQVKDAVDLPVLRKDFIVDAYQIHESRAFGADAILLIGEALTASELRDFTALAGDLELTVLLEVHTRNQLVEALQAVPGPLREHVLFGINNRDLKIQQTDLATTETVAELVPPGIPIVSESGIKTRQDVDRMHIAGARALLVGETLMRSEDPVRMIRQLFG